MLSARLFDNDDDDDDRLGDDDDDIGIKSFLYNFAFMYLLNSYATCNICHKINFKLSKVDLKSEFTFSKISCLKL